jgi:hypothetical protein
VSEARRLRQLEEENQALDIQALKDFLGKK